MKVFILYGVDSHGQDTLGVFDSIEKAELAKEYQDAYGYAYLSIQEYDVK